MVEVEKIEFANGVWRALVTFGAGADANAAIQVIYNGEPLEAVAIENGPSKSEKVIDVTIPSQAIGDGCHTFLVMLDGQSDPIATFSIAGGRTVAHDLLTEVAQLRAELEFIKTVLRKRFAGS